MAHVFHADEQTQCDADGRFMLTRDPREEELVAGYGEFFYAGIVCVTAPTLADLEAATEEVSQVAASVGLEVRPVHGRHDQAVAATLPLARGLAPRGVR